MATGAPLQVHPGRGVGFLTLGASLHDVLTLFKAQPSFYPSLDISYSPSAPLATPVILNLPPNGLRLRFDGPDQRLRLIEILDFTKTPLRYKSTELVKLPEGRAANETLSQPTGPTFRYVYNRLMGPSFPGEYLPPVSGSGQHEGLYILSYPGVAFTFRLQDSGWSAEGDFVEMLSSDAASAATTMAVFDGQSWPESRRDLMIRPCSYPRSLALSARSKEPQPDEIELAVIRSDGKVDLERRNSPTFQIELSKTTPQDLVAELGPPSAIYRKSDRRLSIHKTQPKEETSQRRFSSTSRDIHDDLTDTEHSSAYTRTDESDNEVQGLAAANQDPDSAKECFYNYFDHGFDIFVSYPAAPSPTALFSAHANGKINGSDANQLVATKILFHGNVPGSFPFNRYRRSRWVINLGVSDAHISFDSETAFSEMSQPLLEIWRRSLGTLGKELNQNAMVLNRDWNDSPGSSCEFLGDWEESSDSTRKEAFSDKAGPAGSSGNTKLYGFPGLLFEVLKNNTISCLTVY